MVRDTNTLGLTAPMITESTFSIVFRGYRKREVDQYAQLTDAQLASAIVERQELNSRVRGLSDQLQLANTELVELRRRPMMDDKLSFRHLGPRVEQILAEAEEQADALRLAAAETLEKEKALVEAELDNARGMHDQIVLEVEGELAQQRSDAEREVARLREAATLENEETHAYVRKLRAEADSMLAAAHEESRQIMSTAATNAERVRADSVARAQAILAKAEEDAGALAQSAETYAHQTRESAELHAHDTRTAAEQHAHQTMSAAEQAATQVRGQAELHAAQVRSAAEKHVGRIHATTQPTAQATPAAAAAQQTSQQTDQQTDQMEGGQVEGGRSAEDVLSAQDADASDLVGELEQADSRHRANVSSMAAGTSLPA